MLSEGVNGQVARERRTIVVPDVRTPPPDVHDVRPSDPDMRSLVIAPQKPGALLMIGLPRLPETIKTMGHALADRLMRDAAKRIDLPGGERLLARASDTGFAIWLPGVEKAAA